MAQTCPHCHMAGCTGKELPNLCPELQHGTPPECLCNAAIWIEQALNHPALAEHGCTTFLSFLRERLADMAARLENEEADARAQTYNLDA